MASFDLTYELLLSLTPEQLEEDLFRLNRTKRSWYSHSETASGLVTSGLAVFRRDELNGRYRFTATPIGLAVKRLADVIRMHPAPTRGVADAAWRQMIASAYEAT